MRKRADLILAALYLTAFFAIMIHGVMKHVDAPAAQTVETIDEVQKH